MEIAEAKRQIAIVTAGIVTTLLECGKAPNGILYAAAMATVDFVTYSEIVAYLVGQGLVTLSFNQLALTPKGVDLAKRINAKIAQG